MNQSSLPVLALTSLGIVIAVLGLFAAGNMVVVTIGLGAIFGAGVLGAIERLADRRQATTSSEHHGEEL
jgi:hypothetical protein